jgi:hypothetical protein
MAIGKTVDSKPMHPISKVLSSVGVTIPSKNSQWFAQFQSKPQVGCNFFTHKLQQINIEKEYNKTRLIKGHHDIANTVMELLIFSTIKSI